MKGGDKVTKEEIVLELTLEALKRFDYKVSEYGGNTHQEHIDYISETTYKIYNNIYKNLIID